MKTLNLTNIVATLGKPTLYFLVNDGLKQMSMLGEKTLKRLNYTAFDTFKMATKELIKYES